MTLREKINEILELWLRDLAQPEMYFWVERHGNKSATEVILKAVKEYIPNKAKQATSLYGQGWNDCLAETIKKLEK